MPISGYDPDDLDGLLEQLLDEGELRAHLTDEQWRSYEAGDEELTDMLDDEEVERLLSSSDE